MERVKQWKSQQDFKNITNLCKAWVEHTKFCTISCATGKSWNGLRNLCSCCYTWLPWTGSYSSKNTPSIKIKRAKAILLRPSYMTIQKIIEPEEREDEEDSADDESLLASTSTGPPREQLPGKVPLKHPQGRLKKQNGSCFIKWNKEVISRRCRVFSAHKCRKETRLCVFNLQCGTLQNCMFWWISHTKKLLNRYAKFNMIPDIYPNTCSEKLAWNIICFGVKSDFILPAFLTYIFKRLARVWVKFKCPAAVSWWLNLDGGTRS